MFASGYESAIFYCMSIFYISGFNTLTSVIFAGIVLAFPIASVYTFCSVVVREGLSRANHGARHARASASRDQGFMFPVVDAICNKCIFFKIKKI